MTLRAGEDHEMHFHEFIVYTSGRLGRVRCLILGLMAKAGSVSLELIRFFDTERFLVSDVHAAISKWAVEINVLFLEKKPSPWMVLGRRSCTTTSARRD